MGFAVFTLQKCWRNHIFTPTKIIVLSLLLNALNMIFFSNTACYYLKIWCSVCSNIFPWYGLGLHILDKRKDVCCLVIIYPQCHDLPLRKMKCHSIRHFNRTIILDIHTSKIATKWSGVHNIDISQWLAQSTDLIQ